jgi:hypothetical protein
MSECTTTRPAPTTSTPCAEAPGATGADPVPRSSGVLDAVRRDNERLRAELSVARAKIDDLETALLSSRRIAAAMGILMSQHHLSMDAAFDVLRVASQHNHRKIRDLAEDVLYTGTLDTALLHNRSHAKSGVQQLPDPLTT